MINQPNNQTTLSPFIKKAITHVMLLITIITVDIYAVTETYSGKPRTIAHDFLDMEKSFGAKKNHYEYINKLINKAKLRITVKANYSTVEAINTLSVIDALLKEEGFIFKNNFLLNKGIDKKIIDCDNYCALYTAISEVLKLPIIPVYAPNHSFVRFNFNDGSYLNWETTKARHYPNSYYVKRLKISQTSIENGVYLKSLSRKEFLGVQYNNIGAHLLTKKKFRKAIQYFTKAINYYPNFSSAFHNRGTSFYAVKDLKKALPDLLKASTLDPLRATTENTLGDIYFDLKKYKKAIEHLSKSINLDPSNYVPYYTIGLVLKTNGNNKEASKWIKKSKEIKRKYKK